MSLLSRILVPVVPKPRIFKIIFSVNVKLLTVSYPLLGMSDHLFVYFGPDFSATFSLLAITTIAIPKINVSQNLRFGGENQTYVSNLGLWSDQYPGYEYFHSWDLAHYNLLSTVEKLQVFFYTIYFQFVNSQCKCIYWLSGYSSGLKAFGIFSIFYTWCIFWALCIWILSVAFIHEWFDIKLLNNKCFIPFPGLGEFFFLEGNHFSS